MKEPTRGDGPLMIGVSGLRGIVGSSLTPDLAERFSAAFGAWLRDNSREPPGVVVGADGRAGYEPIHRAAIDGLIRTGCDVVDLGVAMTPTVGVMADHLAAAGGIVVTASHNPQEWNGLKCLVTDPGHGDGPSASAPPPDVAERIIARFRAGDAPTSGAQGVRRTVPDATRLHVDRVTGGVAHDARAIRARRFRVVVDSVNGSGIDGARELMMRFGAELAHRGSEPTGVFPHPPEPTREHLGSLCKAVRTFNADVGFAQDPDADRLAIVDDRGVYIGEEYTLALAAVSLLAAPYARDPGRDAVLAANLSTSRMIDDAARAFHARVVRTPVGEANVVQAMKREAAAGRRVVLGGEGNGGVIWPRVTYVRDSLSGMALVLALMARTGRKLSELVAEIPAYAIEKRKIALARKEDAARAVETLAAHYGSPSGPRTPPLIDRQDGVRIDWPERKAWLHVRASNTEPIMRLIAEAPGAPDAAAVLDEAARVIAP
jgi:phosphomannomutase